MAPVVSAPRESRDAAVERLRRQDLPAGPPPDGPLDVAPLTGVWVGADRQSMSVDALEITERGGACLVQAAGGDSSAPRDWGVVPASVYAADVGGAAAIGLSAQYDFGFLETTLTGFIKSGIFILCTYNRWKDASARANYFTREFLYRRLRRGGGPPAAGTVSNGITRGLDRPAAETATGSAPSSSHVVDPSPVAGRFLSCDRETSGFAEVTITSAERHLDLTLRAAGGPQPDSGRLAAMRGIACAERVAGGPAGGFLAVSESSFQRLMLAAYLNKGLLAIDTYATFRDGSSRRAYRARDHFFRVDPS
jgi:hypothetical protein